MIALSTHTIAHRRSRGFTLIELVGFIVIVAVVMVGMVQAFSGSSKGAYYGKELTQGAQLAQQRMDIILGQRKTFGYTTFTTSANYDPCQSGAWSAQQLCATTAYGAGNFAVSSTRSVDGCGTNCTEIVVTVTSPYGDQLAQLTYQTRNY
jgi:type II secretory pathway pseudopilin PulG